MKVPAKPLEIDFEQFLKELPIDYPEMAYECHAFTRSRKIKTPAQLLQVVMLYCGMDKALRETAGVFTLLEERVTDTAIHKRLKACSAWVKALLKRMLPCEQSYPEASRILVVDGSSLQGPGAKGTDFRLHLALDLVTLTLHEIQVTGFEQGEKLSRFRFEKGDLVIADRGYNHPSEILELAAQGISTVVRLLPTAMPLYHRQAEQELTDIKTAERLDLARYLQRVASDCVSIPVWLCTKNLAGQGSVHALRLPPDAAETARRRCRQQAQRKGRTPSPETLYLAGWLMVFSTVPSALLDGATLLKLYRTRWQIELVFKRLKSVLNLDQLRAKQGSLLGDLWLNGKLLYALVIENHLHKHYGSDWNRLDQNRPASSWRFLKITRSWIDTWILETHRWRLENLLACFEVVKERPRQRKLQTLPTEVIRLMAKFGELGWA